ncbi:MULTISPECIES: HAD-IA family hydrolase [Pseudorhizobium]|uniref:Glycerol-3-phosphatase n=1 Tax=Pseudorhizobium pelagicum TaxID=1509405 RepID=A0A922TC79_9HYPH|nr:HAD-IA family hydrolase [Pseudorhizobium marinum]KEQ08064.1 glycerol-3-phosphatase [Pseudorhizobium pelagicum]KEQ10261.1 glycerol-3-phosphatase [Pseudorhizobium pelagicum]
MSHPDFIKSYAGFLFDMDGTILNSIAAAERVWGRWALRQGLDLEAFLPTMHGKRGIDTISGLNLPGIDPVAEAEEILRGEIEDVEGVIAIDGAADFLASLPPNRWAIVTSAPIDLARARLAAAGIPQPTIMVTAEDVSVGKPDPQGYLLGAERIGASASEMLVFEDVQAGVTAGEAAGADVMVITATHQHVLATQHPTLLDYRQIAVKTTADGRLTIVAR